MLTSVSIHKHMHMCAHPHDYVNITHTHTLPLFLSIPTLCCVGLSSSSSEVWTSLKLGFGVICSKGLCDGTGPQYDGTKALNISKNYCPKDIINSINGDKRNCYKKFYNKFMDALM